ncbi:S-layer homology domain-containing protein [Congzhengia minquanensis]|uniref:S-layer homology domain-containing protein n=1 Tax=Congzhengia minquanensis TaxID=2763657 RepID=A0A926HVQ2_9FIRM|nr:S-layer homology domain-containing protein [Congzhengia minquanensis]MBC8541892.1 S-layer homology domain-containing protein [Congzhengia minquanensis]
MLSKLKFALKKIQMRHSAGSLYEKPSALLYEYGAVCKSDDLEIPKSFRLPKDRIPDCRNQKTTGQCTCFALTGILQILWYLETGEWIQFSTTYAYGRHRASTERRMEGLYPFSLVKRACFLGSVPNEMMPELYEVPLAYDFVQNHPDLDKLDEVASATKIKTYIGFCSADKEKRTEEIKRAILKYQIPVFGNFRMCGAYHAVPIIGWDEKKWYYMNSWGTTYGENGICSSKYDTLTYAILLLDEKNSPVFPFTDVADEHWGSKAIRRCYGAGIINGIDATHFNPEGVLTRAQICQTLYKLAIKFTEANGEIFEDPYTLVTYSDVMPEHWFYNAVRYCSSKLLISEKHDNYFCPDEALTRGEFCNAIWNFIQLVCKSKDMINPSLTKMPFKDIADNDKFYNEIQICYSLGIINGIEKDKFCPDESLNRAQMCQMIYKLIKQIEVYEK